MDKPTWLSNQTGWGKRPTESTLSTAQASTVAPTSAWMWPDKPETTAPSVVPLPPPFGLPPSTLSAISPNSATDGQPDTGNRSSGRNLLRPLLSLGLMGVCALLVAVFWLWRAPAIPQARPEHALATAETPTTTSSSTASGVGVTGTAEAQFNAPVVATQTEAMATVSQPERPLLVERPVPKVDPKAAVAKLSIPALPAPAATSAESPATTAAPSTPAAQMVASGAPPSPREACANSSGASQTNCLDQQCAKPGLRQHTQCQRWRKEREQEFERLYGGP